MTIPRQVDFPTYPRTPVFEPWIAVSLTTAALDPEPWFTGSRTVSATGAVTASGFTWPDGVTGTYTATESSTYPSAIDTYAITYVGGSTRTYTQPTVTRNSSGYVTVRPAIVVT